MKNIVILGSTGSLGRQAVEILEKYKKDFKIIGLSAYKNKNLLHSQAKKLKIPTKTTILISQTGPKALQKLARLKEADIVINVLSGTSGIAPTLAALEVGKTVILGNKESLVAEGKKIMKYKSQLIPLDSEHNAIFEILKKFPNKKIKKIILPCSGGPFLGKNQKELAKITAAQALAHPRWNMGKKISIESATLLNKGLEIIEAHYLFNIPIPKIDVKIHPECVVHGIVEFEKETLAYISNPDMREHIENTLLHALKKTTPGRKKVRPIKPNEFMLTSPDHKTLPGIKIVLQNYERSPCNMKTFLQKEEQIIQKFLNEEINFPQIFDLLQASL